MVSQSGRGSQFSSQRQTRVFPEEPFEYSTHDGASTYIAPMQERYHNSLHARHVLTPVRTDKVKIAVDMVTEIAKMLLTDDFNQMQPYYSVFKMRNTGIFLTVNECHSVLKELKINQAVYDTQLYLSSIPNEFDVRISLDHNNPTPATSVDLGPFYNLKAKASHSIVEQLIHLKSAIQNKKLMAFYMILPFNRRNNQLVPLFTVRKRLGGYCHVGYPGELPIDVSMHMTRNGRINRATRLSTTLSNRVSRVSQRNQ